MTISWWLACGRTRFTARGQALANGMKGVGYYTKAEAQREQKRGEEPVRVAVEAAQPTERRLMDRGWKQFERRVSRDHGVERQPVTGERDGSDAMPHPLFAFQMKLRKAIPRCIREWSDSIHRAATRDGKVGVLIVKEPGKHDENALVILRYGDWRDLHGTPTQTSTEKED